MKNTKHGTVRSTYGKQYSTVWYIQYVQYALYSMYSMYSMYCTVCAFVQYVQNVPSTYYQICANLVRYIVLL